MNSAPWWVVLATALTTGGFTLAGAWFTSRSTLRTKREELDHQRALEREKNLHDRRVELYIKMIPLINIILSYAELQQLLLNRSEDSSKVEALSVRQLGRTTFSLVKDQKSRFETAFYELEKLLDDVAVISGSAVRGLLAPVLLQAENLFDPAGEIGPDAPRLDISELLRIAQRFVWEMRVEIGAVDRDDLDERTFVEAD